MDNSVVKTYTAKCPDCGEELTTTTVSLPDTERAVVMASASVHADQLGIDNPEPMLHNMVMNGVGDIVDNILEDND